MGYLIFSSLIVSNLILAVNKKNYRWYFSVSVFFIFIIFAGNFLNVDYENYQYHFNNYIKNPNLDIRPEIGFQVLYKLMTIISSNYQIMVAVIAFIVSSVVWKIGTKLSEKLNYHNLIWMYLMFPFFIDIVQIRNSVGAVIFWVSILLFSKYNKKVILMVGILLAASFHISFLLFLPFILFSNINKNYMPGLYAVYSICVLISAIMCFTNPLVIVEKVLALLHINIGSQYLYILDESRAKWFVYACRIFLQSLSVGLAALSFYYLKARVYKGSLSYRFGKVVLTLNYYSGFFLILILVSNQFERLYRDLLFLNYILYSMAIQKAGVTNRKVLWILEIVLGCAMFGFYMLLSKDNFTGCFKAVLENNILWNN